MRTLGYVAFAVLAVVLAAVFGLGIYATVNDTDVDTPEQAARKAECRKVEARYFELTGMPADQIPAAVAKLPIEDIEQCGAVEPAAVACMLAATSIQAYHACVPTQAAR